MHSPKPNQHCPNAGTCETDHRHNHALHAGHGHSHVHHSGQHQMLQQQQQQQQQQHQQQQQQHQQQQQQQSHQHQHHQHLSSTINRRGSSSNVLPPHMTQMAISSSNNSCGGGSVGNISGGGGGVSCSGGSIGHSTLRRKSSLTYQQQLIGATLQCSPNVSNECGTEISPGHFSPHPNELYIQHHQHHQQVKLSLQPMERYDDTLACSLPPPSPAPNSDRFIDGNCVVSPPNGQNAIHDHLSHHQQQTLSSSTSNSSISTGMGSCASSATCGPMNASLQRVSNHHGLKYGQNVLSMQQRSVSPNTTRYRINTDRYRDLNPSNPSPSNNVNQTAGAVPTSGRYINSSSHYLKSCPTTLVPAETYSYISSNAHTPVKRYVPTPPPPHELYAPEHHHSHKSTTQPAQYPGPSAVATTKCGSQSSSASSTLPYRNRNLKCCASDQVNDLHPIANLNQTKEHYASSPRIRSNFNSSNKATGKDSPVVHLSDGQVISHHHSLTKSVNMMVTQCNSMTQAHMVATITATGNVSSPQATLNATSTVQVARPQLPTYNTRNSMCSIMSDMQDMSSISATSNTSDMSLPTGYNTNVIRKEETNSTAGMMMTTSTSGSSSTCMHCKTVRRTTGVHQTTQTTGPISPVPQMVSTPVTTTSISYNNQRFAEQFANITMTLTPTTTETNHLTPLTPPNVAAAGVASALPPGSRILTKKQDMITEHIYPQLKATASQLAQAQMIHEQNHQFQIQQQQLQQQLQPQMPQQQQLQSPQPQIQQQLQSPQPQQQQQPPSMEQHYVTPSSMRSFNQQQTPPDAQPMPQPQQQQLQLQAQPQTCNALAQTQPQQQRYSCKKRITEYMRREVMRFFGVETTTEAEDFALWEGRQRRLALRRFGTLKGESSDTNEGCSNDGNGSGSHHGGGHCSGFNNAGQHYHHHTHHHHHHHSHHNHHHATERPDILPIQDTEDDDAMGNGSGAGGAVRRRGVRDNFHHPYYSTDLKESDIVERKESVMSMLVSGVRYIVNTLNKRQSHFMQRRQWSRSFAPAHVQNPGNADGSAANNEISEGVDALAAAGEVFYESQAGGMEPNASGSGTSSNSGSNMRPANGERQMYITADRNQQGWRTNNVMGPNGQANMHQAVVLHNNQEQEIAQQQQQQQQQQLQTQQQNQQQLQQQHQNPQPGQNTRGNRQVMDGVRNLNHRVKLFSINDLDDRTDHRPFFTYWINTVQIIVLFLSLLCYGIGPIGFGLEQRTGQVLVTSLSLQTVQHTEQRNIWIGPRNQDLVHLGAKFATCMRRDVKIIDVMMKTRRQERETACCIRNDDSGCVQSSQADCSVRGLFPTKSISTWKKWSPGESGPGGRISGSVCGLDPKYCDAPASIAPYEWPDDITKWPICRKTNSFSQRFRFKDHTAEHMVCEVIGHPCCAGIYGECRITTREYCDFVNGYFHEEASLCSQISCLNNVCGMFPFVNLEVPDQFYRLFTSLCMHAGILHLLITVIFQHVFLSDLERLIGPIRTAILYIGSGLAGNLTSAVLMPYKPEVGPLASIAGVISSLMVLLILSHWQHLHKPHVALFKLMFMGAILLAIGTLPWQLNFAGIFAGVFSGIFLTIALVPFVSVTKYRRKSKINLIWFCIIFHIFVYTTMLIIFYMFPTELTKLSFGEVLTNSFSNGVHGGGSSSGGNGFGNGATGSPGISTTDIMRTGISSGSSSSSSSSMSSSNNNNNNNNNNNYNRQSSYMHQQPQYHYHHQSDDIIINNVAAVATATLAPYIQ